LSTAEPSLSRAEAEALLYTLCIELGFCIHSPHYDKLCDHPPDDAISFTDAVVQAEGMNVTTIDRTLYRQVRDHVIAAFHRAQARKELELVVKQ
jgi:hypothetical protein